MAAPGTYRVTLHDLGPSEAIYTTLPGGLPPFLSMGGFDLEVIAYGDGQSAADNGGLSGTARPHWAGNDNPNPITVAFSQLAFTQAGDPLHGQVTLGSAALAGGGNVELSLAGHGVRLRALTLSASAAQADLALPWSATFHLAAGARRSGSPPWRS